MKHKLDFVTNSSSTSVVMWGVYLDESEITENEKLMEKIKEAAEKEEMSEDLEAGDVMYVAENVLGEAFGLEAHGDYDNNGLFIGKSPFEMGEDETPRQFKEKIQNQLKELGIENPIEQIVESWMDG